jgi:hypothetical protein
MALVYAAFLIQPRIHPGTKRTQAGEFGNLEQSDGVPGPVEGVMAFLRQSSRYAPVFATSPFFVRDLVTLREHDIFTNCRLPAFPANIWNDLDSAPRN